MGGDGEVLTRLLVCCFPNAKWSQMIRSFRVLGAKVYRNIIFAEWITTQLTIFGKDKTCQEKSPTAQSIFCALSDFHLRIVFDENNSTQFALFVSDWPHRSFNLVSMRNNLLLLRSTRIIYYAVFSTELICLHGPRAAISSRHWMTDIFTTHDTYMDIILSNNKVWGLCAFWLKLQDTDDHVKSTPNVQSFLFTIEMVGRFYYV